MIAVPSRAYQKWNRKDEAMMKGIITLSLSDLFWWRDLKRKSGDQKALFRVSNDSVQQ